MTLKRLLWVLVLAGCLAAPSVWARGNLSQPLTVLVIPARHTMVQLGTDMIQRNYAVLVAYRGEAATANPALYVWDGKEWREISLEDFRASSYLKRPASRIVLVGNDEILPSVLLDAASDASRLVLSIPTIETAQVVNDLGKVFDFKSSDWSWFASRYGLTLTDENQELRTVSWYDKPYNRSGGEAVVREPTVAPPKEVSATGIPREEDIPAAQVIGETDSAPVPSESGWSESAETTPGTIK